MIFLTHDDDARAHYYGDEALARLRALGEVRLNDDRPAARHGRGDRAGRRLPR